MFSLNTWRRVPWVLFGLGAIALLSLALRLAFVDEPFERDEGVYSAIALQILDGGVPYRDGLEQKGPLLFYLYAFGMAVFGQTMEAVRVFTAGYNLVTVLGVFVLARQVAGGAAGLLAAFLYAVASSLPHVQASSSNAEVFLVAPLIWSAVFAIRWLRSGSPGELALAGLANALALLIKVVAAPFSLLLLALVIWKGGRKGGLRLALGAFLLPQAVVAAGVAAYFAAHGALGDMLFVTLLAPLAYVQSAAVITGPELGDVLGNLQTELLPFSVFALLLPFIRPWFSKEPADHYFVALPLVAVLVAVLPGKNFPHYFITLLPFFAAATAVAVVEVVRHHRWPVRLLALVPLLLLVRLVVAEHAFYWKMSGDQVSQAKYGPLFVFVRDLGVQLAARTAPGDYIFQWGFEPQLYLISGRRIPSRIITSPVMALMVPDVDRARLELAGDLRRTRPRYVVVFHESARFPGLQEVEVFLREEAYQLEFRHPVAYAYRRPD